MADDLLAARAARTARHLLDRDFHGYDPYDALTSPLFGLPVLRSSRLLRFGAQQVLRRVPVNVRPLLAIRPQLNPVSVALYLQGHAHRAEPGGEEARAAAARLVARLGDLATPGYSGACWGYPFDWEGRYISIAAGTPTVVATGMVANALAVADDAFDLPEAAELVCSAAAFVREDLNRTPGPGGSFCFSYSPEDRQVVLNATLKGSRLLAQAAARQPDADGLQLAAASARFAAEHQHESGAWPYAIGDTRQWADNFHTGYVLECLHEYRRLTGDAAVDETLQRGWEYYRSRFFLPDMTPRYYDDSTLPIDATACAQAVITLCTFGDVAGAAGVAERAVALLGRPDGSFAYQRRRRIVIAIPYLRWSTAWMYCALARLIAAQRA